MKRVFGLTDLAAALGRSKTYTWYLVQATMEAHRTGAAGAAEPPYLLPDSYVIKGPKHEVFFTAEQLCRAASAAGQPRPGGL